MAQKNFQRLFLLEFMVHEVFYTNTTIMNQDLLHSLGPTFVEFASENFPYICMSEDEFGAVEPFDSYRVKFNKGKSCVFSLKLGEGPVSDKAQISVSRKLSGGMNVTHLKFGTAYLKMSPEFLTVLNNSGSASSSCKCLKVSLDVVNNFMEHIASISIFLRLTYLGTSIYTQCQMDNNNTFSFKGDEVMIMSQRNQERMGYGTDGPSAIRSNPTFPIMQSSLITASVKSQLPELIGKMKDELLSDLMRLMRSNERAMYMSAACQNTRNANSIDNWQEPIGMSLNNNSTKVLPINPFYIEQNSPQSFQNKFGNMVPNNEQHCIDSLLSHGFKNNLQTLSSRAVQGRMAMGGDNKGSLFDNASENLLCKQPGGSKAPPQQYTMSSRFPEIYRF